MVIGYQAGISGDEEYDSAGVGKGMMVVAIIGCGDGGEEGVWGYFSCGGFARRAGHGFGLYIYIYGGTREDIGGLACVGWMSNVDMS